MPTIEIQEIIIPEIHSINVPNFALNLDFKENLKENNLTNLIGTNE